jgi:hypothetical protein
VAGGGLMDIFCLPLIAPSIFSVLERKFKQLASVKNVPEDSHKPMIQIMVVLIPNCMDMVEITQHNPRGGRRRFDGLKLSQKTLFFHHPQLDNIHWSEETLC